MDEPTGTATGCDGMGGESGTARVAMNENEMPKAQRKMRSMGGKTGTTGREGLSSAESLGQISQRLC